MEENFGIEGGNGKKDRLEVHQFRGELDRGNAL